MDTDEGFSQIQINYCVSKIGIMSIIYCRKIGTFGARKGAFLVKKCYKTVTFSGALPLDPNGALPLNPTGAYAAPGPRHYFQTILIRATIRSGTPTTETS